MEFIANHLKELIVSFLIAFIATVVAVIAQNKFEGHDVIPCAKGGAIQGLVFGIMACVAYVLMETL
jgi:hypothetical protein